MRDPFDHPLEPMTSEQIRTDQKERHARQSWMVTGTVILLVACGLFFLMMTWMGKESQKTLGGEPGIIQDGVYYVYGGGGFTLPGEVQAPIGLCAYTPGQEPEVLVSAKEYGLDTIFPCWDVNSHGLYFSDLYTDSLYRMDLETREVTTLYTLPDAPENTNPYIFPNGLWEDRIALICYDGFADYHLVLDCRTGEVLERQSEEPTELTEPREGTLAYEVQRLGLPEGSVVENGQESWHAYLAFADPWLFYAKEFPDENPAIAVNHSQLWAMDVETEEQYLVQDDIALYQVVTDGNWFYNCGGDTDCYQLEYSDDGIPCGLTLIEERI